jgi:hypothetical protein
MGMRINRYQERPQHQVIPLGGNRANLAGHGIQEWKNPVKLISSTLNRQFITAESFRLFFDPPTVTIEGSGGELAEVIQGKFISRAFRHAGYVSLDVSAAARWDRAVNEHLLDILKLAETEKVNELRQALAQPVPGLTLEKILPEEQLIRGEFKHYTDRRGYEGIISSGVILGAEKRARGEKEFIVSLSRVSLSPAEVSQILFTTEEMERIPGRGKYVIAFDLKDGSPLVTRGLQSDRSLEVWVEGNLMLDEVDLTYHGRNQLEFAAA